MVHTRLCKNGIHCKYYSSFLDLDTSDVQKLNTTGSFCQVLQTVLDTSSVGPGPIHILHTYNFEDNVKEITGIFDHMNIDFNPCGHHDEIFFGRPHYDMDMYIVTEYWRDIMQCDVTSCDYQDCKYDQSNQETEVGKAFFDLDVCREPFPNYILDNIPPDAAPPIKPGSFNKSMPFGFLHLPHTGNPRSGIHSINALTALQWNDTQVERWTEPVLFMMSFDKLITIYEPMVTVEFFQGSEARDYTR